MNRQILITGPGGYLGRNLAACFRKAGWRVCGAGRKRSDALDWFEPLDLRSTSIPSWPQADLFIHCAYDFAASTPAEVKNHNVEASIRILASARQSGARVIFISSMAAHAEAQSLYGKGKFKVEEFCRAHGIAVIRPGLLYGNPQGGLAGSLEKAVKRLPVLPYPHYSGAILSTCHVADACLACLALADLPAEADVGQPIIAAADRSWKFQDLLRVMAEAHGRSPLLIPVPWRMPWCALRAAELVGLRPSFRSDSLVSLAAPSPTRPTACAWASFRKLSAQTFGEPSPVREDWQPIEHQNPR